jgi:hypothetical protein
MRVRTQMRPAARDPAALALARFRDFVLYRLAQSLNAIGARSS